MQNVNSNKSAQKQESQKPERVTLRKLARSEGIPEFMLRFARERHLKIFPEQFVPRYRHD